MNTEMLKLEDLGYKKYKASDFESHEWLFQKTIWSDCGKFKKYFININVYDWIEFRNRFPQTDRFSYEPEVFFYSEAVEFTITYRNGLKELKDVCGMEKFFEDVYFKLYCVPDKLNND